MQAVNGPAILYLKAGAPLPEVTIVVKPADAQKAQQTVGTLLAKFAKSAKPASTTVNGVTLQSVSLGPVSLYYGVLDGQLVLTDSQTAIGELQSKSNRLADDDTFKAAEEGLRPPRLVAGVALRRSAGHDPRCRVARSARRPAGAGDASARIWSR